MRNIKNVNRMALTLVTMCSLVGCATKQNDKPSVRPDMPVYEKNGTFRLGNWGVPNSRIAIAWSGLIRKNSRLAFTRCGANAV